MTHPFKNISGLLRRHFLGYVDGGIPLRDPSLYPSILLSFSLENDVLHHEPSVSQEVLDPGASGVQLVDVWGYGSLMYLIFIFRHPESKTIFDALDLL